MNPTPNSVHVNAILTNMSLALMQSASGFVADRVFPFVPVKKQADVYFSYNKGDFNRDEMQERAPSTESAGSGWRVNSDNTYYAKVYALHKDISDQVRTNADAPLQLDSEATTFLTMKALLRKENLFAGKFLKTGVWGTDYLGVASPAAGNEKRKWSDAASDPIVDIRTACRTMLQTTGIKANKLVLGKAVYDTLLDHPDVLDRLKYGQTAGGPAMANRNTLAALFELDSIEVMEAITNSAAFGEADAHGFINSNNALLLHAAPSPGLMTATAGYTFGWTGLEGGNALSGGITQFRMQNLKSDRTEIELAFDQRLVSNELGIFFNSMV